MRVLYVNHTAHVSGAEEALCDLLRALPASIEPVAAAPRGALTERLDALSVPWHEIPATDGSLRLHPLHTPRAVGELVRAGAAVGGLARRVGAEVVHANSIRAGLAALAAPARGAPRPLVHVHDCLPPGPVSSLTRAAIGRRAGVVLANSRHTARRFATRAQRGEPRVAYYGVDTERFDPARIDPAAARARLGVGEGEVVAAVVGQLTPWKGQDHAVRILARLREEHPEVRLLLAGSPKFVSPATRYDNRAYVRDLHELAASLGLGDRVAFLGEVEDVPALLRAVDVALVPSWEEPFGRAVTEALAMEVPVVATSVGGPAEVVDDGAHGFLLRPGDLDGWTEAVARLVSDPELRSEMGCRGRARIERDFSMSQYVDAVLAAYSSVKKSGLPDRR